MSDKLFKVGSLLIIISFVYFIFFHPDNSSATSELPPIVNGQQVVKMTVSGSGYNPSQIKIKVGIPVSWQISGSGNPGCAGFIVAPTLFSGMVSLIPNPNMTKVFTVSAPGTYDFSCSMGMYTGSFEAVN